MIASDELRRADAIAAALKRGLRIDPLSWEQLLAIAQKEIGLYQRRRFLGNSAELYEEELASPLIAAARIVLEVANREFEDTESEGTDIEVESKDSRDDDERQLLLILSSCAFGMYGNFPSAAAVQRFLDLRRLRTEGQWLAVVVSNPRQLPIALQADSLTSAGREFVEHLNYFIHTGDELAGDRLIGHFEELMRLPMAPAEVVFLRCARLVLKHISTLAMARLFRLELGSVFDGFVRGIVNDGRPCLLPPQYNLIYEHHLLQSNENGIVTIPTSTGKTLLGELSIAARMTRNGDLAVYVAPYIALGRQVFDSLKRHAADGVEVRGYFGNFNSHIEPLRPNVSTVIVATPERLDAILRGQNLYARIRTVILDEAHLIQNGVRGARLESLVTRIRLQQSRHAQLRLVMLSAVLNEVEPIRRWLGDSAVHYQNSWRPTARRVGIWSNDGSLRWLWGTDPLRPSGQSAIDTLGLKRLTWPEFVRPASTYQGVQAQKPAAFRNAAYLARYLLDSIGGPVLLACATKANTRGLALAIATSITYLEQPSIVRDDLVQLIRRDYAHLSSLAEMIAKGVAYHNASLPSQLRAAIENAIKLRALHFVAATTTLAEGVDLPFRVTILFDWLVGFGDQQAPMGSLMFRNIAGRCGRAGEFTEGDTIIFDNVLGDLAFTAQERRHRFQAKLFDDPPALRSFIANQDLTEETKSTVRAIVSSQLLASIPENPDDDQLEETWAAATYATFQSANPIPLLRGIREELLAIDSGGPFAMAASPMSLTPLGDAANRSGFGPRTCRLILRYLSHFNQIDIPLEVLASNLLTGFGACDEQSNYLLRDIALSKRTNFYVKAEDLTEIGAGWLRGEPLVGIFLRLPRAMKSKAAITPAQWATGAADYEPVSSQYDKFLEVTEYAFGGFIPWLLRGLGALAPFGSPASAAIPWDRHASRFEHRDVDPSALEEAVASPE